MAYMSDHYMENYWCGKSPDRDELIKQLSDSVGGTVSHTTVVDYKGKVTRRIVIEYESPSDN